MYEWFSHKCLMRQQSAVYMINLFMLDPRDTKHSFRFRTVKPFRCFIKLLRVPPLHVCVRPCVRKLLDTGHFLLDMFVTCACAQDTLHIKIFWYTSCPPSPNIRTSLLHYSVWHVVQLFTLWQLIAACIRAVHVHVRTCTCMPAAVVTSTEPQLLHVQPTPVKLHHRLDSLTFNL